MKLLYIFMFFILGCSKYKTEGCKEKLFNKHDVIGPISCEPEQQLIDNGDEVICRCLKENVYIPPPIP